MKKSVLLFLTALLNVLLVVQGSSIASALKHRNEVLVEWSSIPPNELKSSKRRFLRTFQNRMGGRGYIEAVPVKTGESVDDVIQRYKDKPGVIRVEPNHIYRISSVSNDPYYTNGSLWGMYSNDNPVVGPTGTTNQYGSQAEQAWNQGYLGSTKVVVGVIDTGVDYTHPDLYLNIYLSPGEIKTLPFYNSLTDTDSDGIITFRDLNNPVNASFVSDLNSNGRIDGGDLLADNRWANGVDNDSNGFVDDLVGWDFINNDNDPMDDNEHGTHVSGTIGGIGGNSTGVVGVSWRVMIMPLKFLSAEGWGYTDDAVLAIDYFTDSTQRYDIAYTPSSPLMFLGTNNSWGGGGYSGILKTSIDNGALVNNHFIAAAGNDSSNNNSFPSYPASYSTLAVAGWEAITAVASIASDGSLSWFSNYGSTAVDIGAPGSAVLSSVPGGYDTFNGTSMATPHVSGALSLMLGSFPQTNRRTLREVLLRTVVATPSLSGKVVSNGRLSVIAALLDLASPQPVVDNYIWGTTGNDNLVGTNLRDSMTGVPATGVTDIALGKNQIDRVTGRGGADIFVLGESRNGSPRVFYNNGVLSTVGSSDYLWVLDFNKLVDKLQFVQGRYFSRNASTNTVIYWDRNNNGVLNLSGVSRDEVICIVRNVNLGNLTITNDSIRWVKFVN